MDSIDIKTLEDLLGYSFDNKDYLIQALSHKSYAHENSRENNERFEFLGDAILDFIISTYLMLQYPAFREGMLSKFRAVLVSESGLSTIARSINLGDFILVGKGEEATDGREKNSILADCLEAVIAAVYLDSHQKHGTKQVEQLVIGVFRNAIRQAEKIFSTLDCKTDLQELVQKKKLGELRYKIIDENGPDHDKEFITALLINDTVFGTGAGKSKKISEQNAAVEAMKNLKNIHEN